jgi:carboxymethylenebutenolidase
MTDVDLTDASAARGGSRPLRGYLATPAGEGPWPGVVMVHEAFGLEDVTRRQADRLAEAGFLTLAVDLFSAGGARRCLVSTIRAVRAGQGRAFVDVRTARGWLTDSPLCTGRIGVIGFCMGGAFALMMTGEFDASAPNYGQLPADLDGALAGACPVVASYGGKDFTLRGAAAKLETALSRAGVVHDVKEYPAAGHSFLNDAPTGPRVLRPLLRVAGMGPEPAAAADAWRRIEEFFDAHLR